MAINESERLLNKGITALKAGQRAEARQLLAEAVKANPKSEWGWIYLAALLPPEQAITALERAVKINPQNPQAQQGLLTLRNQITAESKDKKSNQAGLSGRMHRTLQEEEAHRNGLSATPDNLRDLLALPYVEQPAPQRLVLWPIFLSLGLVMVALVVMVVVYFMIVEKSVTPTPAETASSLSLTVSASISATASVATSAEATANAEAANTTPVTATLTNEPTPTLLPAPTAVLISNLRVVQNQKAELKGYALTFNNYDNHSNNFVLSGAGAPHAGRHFEGIVVQLENRFNQTLALLPDYFQALDGRNKYVSPIAGGRLPALEVPRLQPKESRSAWLTFEVEDGTTLRRIIFTGPKTSPDTGSTVEVSLTSPAITPSATVSPTNTSTAVPTNTSTPRPTTIPANSPNLVVRTNVPAVAVSATAPALIATTLATVTNSPEATSTTELDVVVTALPSATATALSDKLPTPTAPARAEMKQRYTLGEMALTVTQYVKDPQVKPLFLPTGYHYETVKITLENLSSKEAEFSEFISSYPFYLRDGDGKVNTVGPMMLDGEERFDPKKFLAPDTTTTKKPQVSGLLYFLVRDGAKASRTLVLYSSNEPESDRVEVALK